MDSGSGEGHWERQVESGLTTISALTQNQITVSAFRILFENS